MFTPFPASLSTLRANARLTNKELAKRAKVPATLIAGLQTGNRRIGEYQARKIGVELGLAGDELRAFVFAAINSCTEKVLEEAKHYPAELLNLLAQQLRNGDVPPEQIFSLRTKEDGDDREIQLSLNDGQKAILRTHLVYA